MESRLSRLEAVQTVLLEIGQRSSTCSDISEFLQAVHAALGRIMYAANFYVALSDRDDGLVRFPYFVDEFDAAPDPDVGVRLASAAQSPTAWVIVNRKQLVMTADDDAMRAIGGGAWGGGTAAEHWIGCPLLDQQHQVLGAIVIQSYDAQHRFSLEDQALFALIATHVSSALQGMQSMDRLEKAVQERTALLAHEVAERRRAENLQHALYEIANLSAQAADATTLYARLHAIISELVTAKNFLIALYHPDNKDITIPYFVDEKDAQAPVKRFHYGIGMSSYVLARRQACLLDADSYAALVASGEMDEPLGNVGIASWMGAPMLLGEREIWRDHRAKLRHFRRVWPGGTGRAGLHGQPCGRGDGPHPGRQRHAPGQGSAGRAERGPEQRPERLAGGAVGTGAPGKARLAGPPGGGRGA